MRRTQLGAVVITTLIAASGSAQATSRYTGIFQPVSYSEDVELNGVYFVTVDEGWVTGGNGVSAGILLHTTDGGAHWELAMGDPAGSQRPFYNLRFVDRTTGFVVQGTQGGDHALLRTIDGQTWRVTGTVPQHHPDYRFVSATVGVASTGQTIVRTTNAGRAWTPVFDCAIRVQVDGLTRTTTCEISSFAFPTPNVGYAIGGGYDVKGLYVMKTEDGGATWTGALAIPGDDDGREGHVFFVDERNGYACLANGKIFGTDDGGATWTGLPGASCEGKAQILFADPEVGWAVRYTNLTWTIEGGRRWVSRSIALPAGVRSFSLPRRDRGYVVGDHGMIFRYVIAPAGTKAAHAVVAPAMPGFSTALADRANDLARELSSLDTTLSKTSSAAASDASGSAATVTPSGAAASGAAPAPGGDALSPFLSGCCGKRVNALELVLKAVSGLVPEYTSKYKNLNLLTLGLRTAGALPERADSLRTAVKAFRSAKDRASADQALTNVKSALAVFRAFADTAVQRTPNER